ncbi:MAG TPA: low affinity iron permease family protein, partial [Candidatus Acidoferrales bacterium]|nr:low affinity iron permease family protein [Candidatus Acidoferrales bacterium]
IVASINCTSNRLIDVEDLTEEELHVLQRRYRTLAAHAKQEGDLLKSHSLDAATHRRRHNKHNGRRTAPKSRMEDEK